MKRLLLIEDNEDFRINTQEILELSNYEVATAKNGVEGVEIAIQEKPDLIICDIMMPQLDGYGVLKILSKNPETSAIPFIFLTAKAENADVRTGMNLGADDYLLKPFEESTLIDAIEARLARTNNLKNAPIKKRKRDFSLEGNELTESLKELVRNRKIKSYSSNEEVYREGDHSHYLFFIIEGKVKCSKSDAYGKKFVTEICNANDFFGYKSILEDKECAETVQAMGDCKLALVPKEEFIELIATEYEVATIFLKMLAANLGLKEERLLQLAYSPVRERTAAAIIELAETQGKEIAGKIEIKITRDELANMVGTAKESLVRMLSSYKKEGIIDLRSREVIVNEIDALKKEISIF